MEVHHHAHTERKKWTHYFWEFLMLFLAVFCGFLAEYQLEHKIEKDREKVYMQNMLEDLRSDTVAYAQYARNNTEVFAMIDSLIHLLKSPQRKVFIGKIYFLARMVTLKNDPLFPNERTYDQMKNSGHLRIVSKRSVSDKISSYYNSLKFISFYNENFRQRVSDYLRGMGKVFDAEILLTILIEKKEPDASKVGPLTDNMSIINEFLTSAQYLYGIQKLIENLGTEREHKAQELITLIKKEYHLN